MKRKIKKVLITLFALIIINTYTFQVVYAKDTQDELDEQISGIEKDKEKAQSELDKSQQSYDEILAETQQIQEDIKSTKAQITQAENDIETLNTEIENLDKDIETKEAESEELKGDADSSLLVLQSMSNQNFDIEAIFGDSDSIGEVFNRAESAQVLTSSITTSFDELVSVLTEIQTLQTQNKAKKETLVTTKTTLEESQTTLEEQENENQELLTELNNKIAQTSASVSDFDSSIDDLESQKDVLESAGCSGDDVYGVDCAVPDSGEPSAPPTASSGFTRPTNSGLISNPYGYAGYDVTGGGFHPGVDIANSCGTPLYASAPGTVITAQYTNVGYGHYIAIAHNINGTTYVSLYGHMQDLYVSPGQTVTYNTQIGTMGTTGSSTGCHVHFSINYGSQIASYSQIPYGFANPSSLVSLPNTGSWFYSRY